MPNNKKDGPSNVALAYFYIAVLMVAIAYFSYSAYSNGILEPIEYYFYKYFPEQESEFYVPARASTPMETDDWFVTERTRVGES
jgi:hypothetical protein